MKKRSWEVVRRKGEMYASCNFTNFLTLSRILLVVVDAPGTANACLILLLGSSCLTSIVLQW